MKKLKGTRNRARELKKRGDREEVLRERYPERDAPREDGLVRQIKIEWHELFPTGKRDAKGKMIASWSREPFETQIIDVAPYKPTAPTGTRCPGVLYSPDGKLFSDDGGRTFKPFEELVEIHED